MTLLASHLEQISASAKTLAELEFPPPKIFTNALLNSPEITTLIRDTEPHERALFSIDPNGVDRHRQQNAVRSTGLENGLAGRKSGFFATHPMKHSVVSSVLGNEMLREIRQSSNERSQGGVNVEVLLRGAEKLCEVYAVAGASDKIRALRNRHREVRASIAVLEEKVSKQKLILDSRNLALNSEKAGDEDDAKQELINQNRPVAYTEEDFQMEEDEIRELETRKKELEDRVSGIEKDLGGLLK